MIIKLLVEGGNMKPGPTLAQKVGPLGLNMGKLISDVNIATKNFTGMKVPVSVEIDTKTKGFKVSVSAPPTAELLKKELGAEKGTGASKKIKIGNASIEQIIEIAKTKTALEKDLKSALKTTLGSCVSLGILVENKDPKEVIKEVNKGIYDKEIAHPAKPSKEKLEKLKEFFDSVKKKQEEMLKKEEEEKARLAAEAAAAAAVAAPTAAAPGAAAVPTAAVPAAAAPAAKAPAKEEKKK